jgi:hypothetical protein
MDYIRIAMPSPECPQCHMPMANAMGKIYCPQCGWNREAAEKQTRLFLRLLPVLVMVFDAPLIIWIFIGHAEIPILGAFAALAIVPAILVVLVVKGKVRIGALGAPSAQPAGATPQAGAASITAPNEAVAEQYTVLAELPRPRQVRMSRQGKMNVTMIWVALLLFACALIAMAVMQPAATPGNITPPRRPLVYVLPLGLVAAIMFVMQRALDRQRQLLADGELVMARVTKQWIARNGNGIRYEFTTLAGETLSRMTTDNARQLLVGMTVPVFYDALKPKKQVALCAAFYEIVLPGQE